MERDDQRDPETAALRDRLSRLSAASLRINENLDFDDLLPDRRPLRGDDLIGRRGRGAYAVAGLSIDYSGGGGRWKSPAEYALLLYEPAIHAPRALTGSVLLRWAQEPERVGEGSLLRNVVKKLRRKLGDAASNPRYIVTEPRVGYRMAEGDAEAS